ncbi:MAG: TIGR03905 family TSCPD domain-containing protein [Lachnospiraceae bacterium]|nr:TIGR03905 family TSCPD domain-containing protein [Lachnospiraceae bacterium]
MRYNYKTEYTCSQLISFDIDGDVISNVEFLGGCNGNLKAISTLVDGWTVDQIENKLLGITCGRRPTSCSDQLAKAVRAAYEAENSESAVQPVE